MNIYALLSGLPLIGGIIRILNAYAFKGDARSDEQFAPLWDWISAYGIQVSVATLGALICEPSVLPKSWEGFIGYLPTPTGSTPPWQHTLTILPNVLGFGIGVYALIFGLNRSIIQDIQISFEIDRLKNANTKGSALQINAEMALPLIIYVVAIAFSLAMTQFEGDSTSRFASWALLWLALVFTLEIIYTLFDLGDLSVIKNAQPPNNTPESRDK
jgi:hypothetical protein